MDLSDNEVFLFLCLKTRFDRTWKVSFIYIGVGCLLTLYSAVAVIPACCPLYMVCIYSFSVAFFSAPEAMSPPALRGLMSRLVSPEHQGKNLYHSKLVEQTCDRSI